MWFEKWFSSKLYLDLYRHRNDEDARQIINLLQRSLSINTKSKVLDIACGAGRHSLELARRGFEVTGFDLSNFLISEAKKNLKNAKEKNLHVKFFIKDMRNFNFKNSFDIVVNIFTSFGYFEEDRENFRVIENVSGSLKKNGYFLFDYFNKTYLEKNLVPFSRNKVGSYVMKQKRRIENGFVKKEIVIENKNKVMRFEEKLKLYSALEFKRTFENYGLVIKKLFGDYYGNKFHENKSQRLIIIAQKVSYILLFLVTLYSGCGLFDTREVEPPSAPRSTFIQPTSPDIVLANLNFAISEKNRDNYLRCMVDSNFSTRRFKFFPDAVSQSSYPVFLNWNLTHERNYYSNLLSFTNETASSNLFLSNITINTGIDSAVIDSDYILVFDHNRPNVAKVTKGKLRFIMGSDIRSLWSIHSWFDFTDNSNDTTWSVLKANFVN